MGYDGYEEHICANGHRYSLDATYGWYGGWEESKCPHCSAPSVWYNCVDQTNCDNAGEIPEGEWEKFLISPDKYETCPTCNHTKQIEHARYRLPSKEELKAMRTYLDMSGVLRWEANDNRVGGA